MNKLAEIKQRRNDLYKRGYEGYEAKERFHNHAESDMKYLLSLIEEKDKALEFYADKESYISYPSSDEYLGYDAPEVMDDKGETARTALLSTKEEHK